MKLLLAEQNWVQLNEKFQGGILEKLPANLVFGPTGNFKTSQ